MTNVKFTTLLTCILTASAACSWFVVSTITIFSFTYSSSLLILYIFTLLPTLMISIDTLCILIGCCIYRTHSFELVDTLFYRYQFRMCCYANEMLAVGADLIYSLILLCSVISLYILNAGIVYSTLHEPVKNICYTNLGFCGFFFCISLFLYAQTHLAGNTVFVDHNLVVTHHLINMIRPLLSKQIDKFLEKNSTGVGDECIICLQTKEKWITLKCSHTFHHECMKQYLKYDIEDQLEELITNSNMEECEIPDSKCPVCRKIFSIKS